MRIARNGALLGVCAALACGASSVGASVISFDPDGAGPLSPVNVASFDLLPGSSLDQGIITASGTLTSGTATVLFQARLGSFLDSNGAVINVPGLNDPTAAHPFQITVTAQFNVTAVAVGSSTVLSFAPGGTNAVNYYYNNALVANDLTGTGFITGAPIASGAATIVSGIFLTAAGAPQLFDQFGPDDYSGKTTITGIGGTAFNASVSSVNPAWFLTPGVSAIMGNTSNQLAYDQANPSQKFFGSITPNLGPVNGSGPDIELQTDGVTSFVIVPEPASLLLLAVGGVGLLSRRKR